MAVNKVIANGETLIDLTQITLNDSSDLLVGITAHGKDGTILTGTSPGGTIYSVENFNASTTASSEGYTESNPGVFG